MGNRSFAAHITKSPGADVSIVDQGHWRLEIPASPNRTYRLAQLDDHGGLPRDKFLWEPPLTFSLQARASGKHLPGTWGFGFWNEPFSFLIGGDRTARRLPTLPNAAWFFHASPENYLSFRDDLPASGYLAATFSSKKLHPIVLALATPALGLTLLPFTAQIIRGQLRHMVQQDAGLLNIDVTDWHSYSITWQQSQVSFTVDDEEVWRTGAAPPPPLCLVIWIDNQYAALPPGGRLGYGTIPNTALAWLEVKNISLSS